MVAKCRPLWDLALGVWFIQDCYSQNLTDTCRSNDCVTKCCGENQILLVTFDADDNENQNCVAYDKLAKKYSVNNTAMFNYSYIGVYDKNFKSKVAKVNKSFKDFRFAYEVNFTDSSNSSKCFPYGIFETYFTEDGKLVLRRRNYWTQWVVYEAGQFCIEHEMYLYEGFLESNTPSLVLCQTLSSGALPSNERVITNAYGYIVSCVFLILVLAVYGVLPGLRNRAGWILMAYMSTYLAFFFVRIIHVFGNEYEVWRRQACAVITIIFHYFMLATFCWMNVMSFDIWWTFRRTMNTSGHRDTSKLRWYCVYAWGLPVLPTLFIVMVDRLDLKHVPDFVQPHLLDNMCYFEPEVHMLYVCIPLLILICVNIILFVLTAFKIWNIRRDIAKYKDSANNKKEEHRFWVYLRLSLLMGVSWILAVIGNMVKGDSVLWTIVDLYNALVGLFIFLLFVCKKKILLQLCDRFSINNKWVEYVRERTQNSSSSAYDTHTKTCHNTYASDVDCEDEHR